MNFSETFIGNRDAFKELIKKLSVADVVSLCQTNREICGDSKVWEQLMKQDFGHDIRSLYLMMKAMNEFESGELMPYHVSWFLPHNDVDFWYYDADDGSYQKMRYDELLNTLNSISEEEKKSEKEDMRIIQSHGIEVLDWIDRYYPYRSRMKEIVDSLPGPPVTIVRDD